jgi:hypothetical protein
MLDDSTTLHVELIDPYTPQLMHHPNPNIISLSIPNTLSFVQIGVQAEEEIDTHALAGIPLRRCFGRRTLQLMQALVAALRGAFLPEQIMN